MGGRGRGRKNRVLFGAPLYLEVYTGIPYDLETSIFYLCTVLYSLKGLYGNNVADYPGIYIIAHSLND